MQDDSTPADQLDTWFDEIGERYVEVPCAISSRVVCSQTHKDAQWSHAHCL